MEMPPVSKVMPLPTSPRGVGALLAAAVVEDDELGRLVAALGDAEEGAHAQLLHIFALEDLALQAALGGDGLRPFRHVGRGQVVGGLVGEVAGPVRRLGEDAAALDAAPEGPQLRRLALDEDEIADLAFVLLFLLVALEGVESEDGAFYDGLGAGFGAETARAGAVGNGGDAVGAMAAQVAGGDGDGVAQLVEVELLRLAQAEHEDTRRGDAPQGVNEGQLVRFAMDLPLFNELGDCPSERLIDCRRRAGGGRPLEQGDDYRLGGVACDISTSHADFHERLLRDSLESPLYNRVQQYGKVRCG